jgi:hypothetical protein
VPRSRVERGAFVGVALTAGICEEILYRGFGLAFLHWAMPTVSIAVDIVVISLAFGVAHAYQGGRGVAAATIGGGLFGLIVASSGTLFVAIAIHALVDLRILGLSPDLIEALDQQARVAQQPAELVESTSTAHVQDVPIPSSPAGWYRDSPQGEVLRWWDGTNWTDHTHPPPDSEPQPNTAPGSA